MCLALVSHSYLYLLFFLLENMMGEIFKQQIYLIHTLQGLEFRKQIILYTLLPYKSVVCLYRRPLVVQSTHLDLAISNFTTLRIFQMFQNQIQLKLFLYRHQLDYKSQVQPKFMLYLIGHLFYLCQFYTKETISNLLEFMTHTDQAPVYFQIPSLNSCHSIQVKGIANDLPCQSMFQSHIDLDPLEFSDFLYYLFNQFQMNIKELFISKHHHTYIGWEKVYPLSLQQVVSNHYLMNKQVVS